MVHRVGLRTLIRMRSSMYNPPSGEIAITLVNTGIVDAISRSGDCLGSLMSFPFPAILRMIPCGEIFHTPFGRSFKKMFPPPSTATESTAPISVSIAAPSSPLNPCRPVPATQGLPRWTNTRFSSNYIHHWQTSFSVRFINESESVPLDEDVNAM